MKMKKGYKKGQSVLDEKQKVDSSDAVMKTEDKYWDDVKNYLKKVKNDKSLSKEEKENLSKRVVRLSTKFAGSPYTGIGAKGVPHPKPFKLWQPKTSSVLNKKGGSVSKYSKGGGVRAAKYKI